MSAGKGMQPRKGYNWQKYADNYDGIFRQPKQQEPMKPNQDQPNPQTILPWHREAAAACFEKTSSPFVQDIITSIARHDPHAAQHATTLRLLGEAFRWVDDYNCRMSGSGVLVEEIRAHLAAMKGSQ